MLVVSIPVAMDGSVLALILDASSLQVAFGVILIFLALLMLRFSMSSAGAPMSSAGAPMASATSAGSLPIRTIQARDGREYTYVLASRRVGLALCGFGALLTGLMSAGLPEVNTTQILVRYRMVPRVAVASSTTILSITVFFAAGIHALGGEPVWHVVAWSIPGVVAGAQIGPRLQGLVPAAIAHHALALIFIGVGVLVIVVRLTGD